jgi:tyrosine N-monooxygenase
VPKGSHVILSRTGLGRNPRVWEHPLRFDPDRHIISCCSSPSADVALTESDLRSISFSTGRRGCIAASLGTAMSIMLFARLLQGFTWTKPDGVAALDLSESKHDTFLGKPLLLRVEPRLLPHLYPPVSTD